jgi:hypothetical protein
VEGAQTLFLGDDGDRFGIATHREGAADFAPTAAFELRDRNGDLIWRIGSTEDVTYVISKGGAVVGMSLNINIPEHNLLHFYGDGGMLEAEVRVPHLTGGRFDPSGSIFLAMSATDGLLAFDSHGIELWRTANARMVASPPGGGRIAVLGDDVLRIVAQGRTTATAPLDRLLVRRLAIAPDGSRVAIATKHEIRIYDGGNLNLLVAIPLEDRALSWTSVDLGSANGWLVAGVARDLGSGHAPAERHPDGEVRAYDPTGRLVHQATLEFPIWNIWTPTVILDSTGLGLTVTTRRAVYRTVLP